MIANTTFLNMLNSPLRTMKGRVELFNGSTLTTICNCHDNLESFTVERIGEQGKFFGFGISQKLTVNLIDRNRELNITTDHNLEIEFGIGIDYIYPCPNFYITDVNRDETTNKLTITAYDALYKASAHRVSELNINTPYTIKQFAAACAALLGVPVAFPDLAVFDTVYSTGANFEGTETIREALNAVAEATQTIYYINSNWELVFKKLDIAGEPVFIIDKNKYVKLDCKPEYVLGGITHATELGDNVSAGDTAGTEQFVRDNPFWELREDIGQIVEAAVANVSGLTITPFNCDWRGNFLLEPTDKIGLITKNDETVFSYVLNDSFKFNGGLSGNTQWEYNENKTETASNPSTLGEALKQTYARVDKVNKEITLTSSKIESIQNTLGENGENFTTLQKQVEQSITPEQMTIAIRQEMSNGVNKVETSTGFTFDESGLTIAKNTSEIKTTVSEDGMKVYKGTEEMLVADNQGVKAKNLHATTYLWIGKNSRIEDYGNSRTGCFWIGGNK